MKKKKKEEKKRVKKKAFKKWMRCHYISTISPRTATGGYRVLNSNGDPAEHKLNARGRAGEVTCVPSNFPLPLPCARPGCHPLAGNTLCWVGLQSLLGVVIKCTLIMLGRVTRTTWNNTLPTHWENQVCHTPLCHGFKNISTDRPSLRLGWRGV